MRDANRRTYTATPTGGVQPVPAAAAIHTDLAGAVVLNQFTALASGLTELREASIESDIDWPSFVSALAGVATIVVNAENGDRYRQCVAKFRTGPVLLAEGWSDGDFRLTLAAGDRPAAAAAVRALRALIPARPPYTSSTVDVAFWSYDPMMGATSRRRPLERLAWEDIEGNYPLTVRPALGTLAALTGPPVGGNLLVFHGPPGTGKTRLLQSLAASWQGWCDVHYVIDPDKMLADASYLVSVILGANDDRWRLVVIEDGDEFIDVEAKSRTGHSIARLLNVADGLVGQGLRVMLLVSTNVAAASFAEAVVRTGRCGAQIEFPPFTVEEAAEWCAARGRTAPEGPATLAELYGSPQAT